MIHIETSDPDTDEMIINTLSGWIVQIDNDTNVMVRCFNRNAKSQAVLTGLALDDDDIPLVPEQILEFLLEDINILIY